LTFDTGIVIRSQLPVWSPYPNSTTNVWGSRSQLGVLWTRVFHVGAFSVRCHGFE